MVEVVPPITTFVEDPFAPMYIREDVASVLNQKAEVPGVEPPTRRSVVFVAGLRASFVASYDQKEAPAGQFVPFSRQTDTPPTTTSVAAEMESEVWIPPGPTINPPPTVS
jgi:hypothetical protein